MSHKIAVLPGDGIGPEVIAVAIDVIQHLEESHSLGIELEYADIGGTAYDKTGTPLPDETLELCQDADAILLGAVGGPKWESIDFSLRPERGLLKVRSELVLFSNLRPAILFPQLVAASTLKPEIVSGLDIMIVRELTGGIYFGQPRGVSTLADGQRQGINTLVYTESEVERIAHSAFRVAAARNNKLCSVDKANVLECTEMWREVVSEVATSWPDVELSHLYVDNAAMQLVRAPKQFDVIVTTNMFGDILSDAAAMLTGSIGMLPSASLDANGKGMYEPIHGSAPDIAGQDKANPMATVLSVAMMFRYTFELPEVAEVIENAVSQVLESGLRTPDIQSSGAEIVGTRRIASALIEALG